MIVEKILKNGFLDNELNLEVSKIRNENDNLYSSIEKINFLLYEIEKNFEKDNCINVELYVFTTFSQIHTSFQSYILLLERGLYDDSQIVLRSIYDKVFTILYVLDNKERISEIDQDDVNKQISLCNYILDNELFEYMPKERLRKEIKELEKSRMIKENGKYIRIPDNRTISEILDLKELYLHYKLLSQYTHNSIYVVEEKIIKTKKGVLINQNIKHGDFKDEIAKIIFPLKYIIDPICDYLGLKKLKEDFEYEKEKIVKI